MAGLKELSALAANTPDAAGPKEQQAVSAAERMRTTKKRKGQSYGLPCGDSLEALRSVWEGFEAAAAAMQNRLSERESAVTVREVACCSVEARLAQRLAQLEDWEGRLRDRAAGLQQVQASLQEQQERARRLACNSKGISLHDDTDSDLEAAEVPAGAGYWAPALQQQQQLEQPSHSFVHQAVQWQPEPQFRGFWADSTHYGGMTPEQQAGPSAPPAQHCSPKLHFAALEADGQGIPRVGVRLVCSAPTPTNSANSVDSQSHGSADTAAAGHAVHSRPEVSAPAHSHADGHVEVHASAPAQQQQQQQHGEALVGMPCKLGMKLAKMEGSYGAAAAAASAAAASWQQPQQQLQPPLQVPPLFQSMVRDGEQKLDSLAQAAEVVEGVAAARARSPARLLPGLPEEGGAVGSEADAVAGPYVKALDYKSCDHILCLTKDMARELFPPAPHSSAGGPSQATVELLDDSGRTWQMTYRCVPHRYSYELRAGWKGFAQFWNVGVGDTVVLWRDPPPRSALRISIRAPTSYAPCPAAATRHGAGRASVY